MIGKILETLLICLILSIDMFIICFSYGISKIKIPLLSCLLITFVNVFFIALGVTIAYFLHNIVPEIIFTYTSISLLLIVGLYNFIKELVHRNNFQPHFDKNDDKKISLKEAFLLSLILTPDGFCVSLSFGNDLVYIISFLIIFSITAFLSVFLSSFIGYKISKKIRLNFSWLSGLCLIIFAVVKLILALVN